MLFTDKIALSGTRRTGDGYLVADARVARTGIQIYLGREVGKPEMEQVRVFRPEAEVFSDKALASFAHRPVTNDHPAEAVGARNWKQHSVGMTGGDIARDGEFVRVPMTVMDQAAIDAVEAGKRELSMGYACDLDFTAGTTPAGEAYDAIQKNIRGNHLAIVDAGRAGPQCRIGDSWADLSPTKEPLSMKTLMVDGITVEMSDTAVQVVSKVLQQLSDAKATVDAQDKKIGELNTAVSTKDGEIAVLKKQVEDGKMTPAQIDAAVQARQAVIADAKAITGADITADGKTDVDIRRATVEAKLGDAAKGMDDAAIDGAFKALRASLGDADPVRGVIKDGIKVNANDAWGDNAFAAAGVTMKKGA
ncbi:hypothetical protein BTHI11S_05018 [Bosea thiooxidans]|uniref:DUF2213 domain-containing protein n=1 Tax=Bosea thiooxidans TaxID=53254 RepID=A0A1T5FLR5_9HYPH|nr:DUF2213 domain-containing protein [Bosea thiooxidans]SKB97028.1 hypothetical protein SAMN05660750_03336 [Bosea thiooxidans]